MHSQVLMLKNDFKMQTNKYVDCQTLMMEYHTLTKLIVHQFLSEIHVGTIL